MQDNKDTKIGLTNNKKLNAVTIVCAVTLIVSVIPIIIASFYSHPFSDDLTYSLKIHHVILNGGGLFDVLSASFQQVHDSYLSWQGTYAAIFIFSLQPAVFSESLYFLTSIVMLTALIGSTIFFINTIFHALNFDKRYGFIISFILLMLSIHFVIDKNQAFFWWNGCSYYTLFYSFSLLFFSFLIKLYFTTKLRTKIIYLVISLILAVIIGGGNFCTALFTTIILLMTIIVLAFKPNKNVIPYCIIFLVLAIGFAISIAAPGNRIRAAVEQGESPIRAIIDSVYFTIKSIAQWTGFPQIAGFIVIAFLALFLTKNTENQYKYPFLIFIISVLLFATQMTPAFYGIGNMGPGRILNIYYFSYYLLISFNIFYVCGWITHKNIVKITTKNIKTYEILFGCFMVICIFFAGVLSYGVQNITFIDTTLALKNGIPQQYNKEYQDRIEKIKNGMTTINDIETVPDFFHKFYINLDPNHWINRNLAQYYDVDEIRLKPNQNLD